MKEKPRLQSMLFRVGVGAVLASSILLGVVVMTTIFRVLPGEIRNRNEMISYLVAQQLDSYLLSQQKELTNLARVVNQVGDPDRKFTERSVLDWSSDFFESVLSLNDSGRVVFRMGATTLPIGSDLSSEPFFRNLPQDSSPLWSPVANSGVDNRPHATMSLRIHNGILVASVSLKNLAEYVKRIHLKPGAEIYILDRQGTFVYHPDSTQVQELASFEHFVALAHGNDSSQVHVVRVNGHVWEATLRQISSTGWFVLMLSDPAVTYDSIFVMTLILIGVVALLLILVATGSAALFRRLLGPFERFMAQVQQVSGGFFIHMNREEPFQEFESLRNQFNGMVESIDERQMQLLALNQRLEQELNENQIADEAFAAIMRTLAKATGNDLFQLVVTSLSDWLEMDFVIVGELTPDGQTMLLHGSTQAIRGAAFSDPYSIENTPSEQALRHGFYLQLSGCMLSFPLDENCNRLQIDSYLGIAIRDREGKNLGVLALQSTKPLSLPSRSREVLQILADRCGSELVRAKQEQALQSMNQDLTETTQSLELKNQEMESILYATSHDLKAPLVNISGFTRELTNNMADFVASMKSSSMQLPREAAAILEDISNSLHFIQNGVVRMDMLLNGLLRLFRTGRNPLAKKNLDLSQLVSELARDLSFELDRYSVALEYGTLPKCFGDQAQLAQVFQNLITNAIKYRDPTRSLCITITGSIAEKGVEIVVADNGKGIAPNEKERVFQLFYRATNSKGTDGEGLGLTIVKRIIDQHLGEVHLESEEGQGTRFRILLPFSPD